MNEQMCNSCRKLVQKIRAEMKKDPKHGHNYRDENGGVWHGNTCPTCFRADANTRYSRYYRAGTSAKTPKNTRMCRKCGKRLTKGRYFYHPYCMAFMVEAYGEQEYGGFCSRGEGF